MSDFIKIDGRGAVFPESPAAHERLLGQAGRFYLAPTSPDLLLGIRTPCQGGRTSGPRVILAGDLSGIQMVDLVSFINQSRITGVLRVFSAAGERSIFFKSGDIHGASSDDPADRMGAIAVRLGLVSQAQLERVLAAERPVISRVGRALVEAGHLQPHELWRCVQHQVSEIFHAILLAQEGAFVVVDQPVDEGGTMAINTQGLLMDAIRRIDEMKEFRKKLPSSAAYVVRVKPPGPNLQPDEREVYAQCTGSLTVAELAQRLRLSEFDATRILYHLISMGLVSIAAGPASQPAAHVARGPSPEEIAQAFDRVFQEIFAEAAKVRYAEGFLSAANGALAQQANRTPVLVGLRFGPDASLRAGIRDNLMRLGMPPADASRLLHRALSELMLFLLFEVGERLDPAADEELSQRVKALLSPLEAS